MSRIIPADAMFQREGDGPAHFIVNEALEVSMSNGEGVCLSLQLTPNEARGFAEVFLALADEVEAREGDLSALECVGEA